MKKKFTTLIVLVLFIFSIMPMAFAEDNSAQNVEVKDDETNTTTIVEVKDLEDSGDSTEPDDDNTSVESQPTATLYQISEGKERKVVMKKEELQKVRKEVMKKEVVRKEVMRKNIENTKERYEKHIENAKERLEEMRNETKERMSNAKERIEGAREKYNKAKQHYTDAKNKYQEKKSEWTDVKEKWEKCKNSTSEECEQAKERAKEHAKPFLLNSADLVIKELERVKEKVMTSEDLSDEEILEIVSDIEDRIIEVESAKATIEDLGEDATREDINDAAKIIREAWTNSKTSLKRHVGTMVNARLGNIVEKTDALEERFKTYAQKLEKQGKDTSVLDSKVEEFGYLLDKAENSYEQAKSKYAEATTSGEVDDAAKEAHELMTTANEKLKEARVLMREMVQEIKSINDGDLDVTGIEDDDNEEESDDVDEDSTEDESDEE